MISECRSCHAQIRWAKTVAGKPMPLNVDAHEDGNVEAIGIERNGTLIVRVLKDAERTAALFGKADRYITHFATCAFADQHRKSKT